MTAPATATAVNPRSEPSADRRRRIAPAMSGRQHPPQKITPNHNATRRPRSLTSGIAAMAG
ncbi:hypothetical protein [Nonomuraea sp. NPDC003201]